MEIYGQNCSYVYTNLSSGVSVLCCVMCSFAGDPLPPLLRGWTLSWCWYCRAVFSRTSARITARRASFSSSSLILTLVSRSSFLRFSTMAVFVVRNDLSVRISLSALCSFSRVVFNFSTSFSRSYNINVTCM